MVRKITAFLLLFILLLEMILPSLVIAAPVQQFVVYEDSLASGWMNWSWNSSVTFTDTTPHTGIRNIRWTSTGAYAGLYLHTDTALNTGSSTALTFALRATRENQEMRVQLYDTSNRGIGQNLRLNAYGGAPNTTSYTIYTIPLADLSGTNANINGLHIQDVSGNTTNQFYVDALAFISDDGSTPSPTVVMTPTPSNTPAPTPTVGSSTSIYGDSLRTGWTDWSWSSANNFQAAIDSHAGTYHIDWKPVRQYAGLYLHTDGGFSTNTFTHLRFAVKATQPNQIMRVRLYNTTNTGIGQNLTLNNYGGAPSTTAYTIFTVPLSDLDGVNKTINGLHIQDASGSVSNQFFVDSIEFISNAAVTPTPTIVAPTVTPSPTPTIPAPTPALINLIPNPTLNEVDPGNPQRPRHWVNNRWGTNTAAFSYPQEGSNRYVHIQMSSYSSGDAKWYPESIPVTPGQRLIYKDQYRSNTTTFLVLQYQRLDGSFQYVGLPSAPAATNWMEYQADFTVPAGVNRLTVLHIISGVGFLSMDNVSLSALQGFHRGLVTVTFDDAVATQYTKGFPILSKYAIPATFYVPSGYFNRPGYMTPAQAIALRNAGHQLSAHTVSHKNLTTTTDAELDFELLQSKQDLENWFGVPFEDFATPFGAYDGRVLSKIRQYYRSHRSVRDGYNSRNNFDIYNIKVKNVLTNTPVSEVASWLQQAAAEKTWIVLVYHQFDNPYDGYSVTTADFDTHMGLVRNSGLAPVTLDQALDEIEPQVQ